MGSSVPTSRIPQSEHCPFFGHRRTVCKARCRGLALNDSRGLASLPYANSSNFASRLRYLPPPVSRSLLNCATRHLQASHEVYIELVVDGRIKEEGPTCVKTLAAVERSRSLTSRADGPLTRVFGCRGSAKRQGGPHGPTRVWGRHTLSRDKTT